MKNGYAFLEKSIDKNITMCYNENGNGEFPPHDNDDS